LPCDRPALGYVCIGSSDSVPNLRADLLQIGVEGKEIQFFQMGLVANFRLFSDGGQLSSTRGGPA